MKKQNVIVAAVFLGAASLLSISVRAQQPETFEQAKEISVRTQRPILLEFYRDD